MKTKLKLLKESIEYISDLEVRKEVLDKAYNAKLMK